MSQIADEIRLPRLLQRLETYITEAANDLDGVEYDDCAALESADSNVHSALDVLRSIESVTGVEFERVSRSGRTVLLARIGVGSGRDVAHDAVRDRLWAMQQRGELTVEILVEWLMDMDAVMAPRGKR